MKKIIKIFAVLLFFSGLFACSPTNKDVYYKVDFDTNGGTPETINSQQVLSGSLAKEVIAPTKEDAIFLHWFNEELNKVWDFKVDIVEQDILLKAIYQNPDTFVTVTFNYNVTNVDQLTVSILEGSSVSIPNLVNNEGYLFLGWFLNNELFDFNSPVNESIELTAKWQVIELDEYEVTFNFNMNGVANVVETVIENELVTSKLVNPIEGTIFVGWYLGNELFDFNTPITSDITLTAKYEEITYTLTINEHILTNIEDFDEVPYNTLVTLEVIIPEGKKIDVFRVNEHFIFSSNTYSFNIKENSQVVVVFKDIVYNEIKNVEDFSVLAAWKQANVYNSSEYMDYTYTGSNDFNFDLINARVDLGMKAGDQGITLAGRGNEITQAGMGWIMLEEYDQGISRIAFTARLPFSPNSTYPQGPGNDTAHIVTISVYVNDDLIAKLKFTDNKTANKGQTFILDNLNYKGTNSFRIEVSSGHRLTIGSLEWTSNIYGDEPVEENLVVDFEGTKFIFDYNPTIHELNGVEFVLNEVHTDNMHPTKELAYMTEANGDVVARFRGASTNVYSNDVAYMYNYLPFDYVSKISFDAKQFGDNGYYAPDAKIRIYYMLEDEEEFTFIEELISFDTQVYQNYEVSINKSNVIVKIEVVEGTLNIDNIEFVK